MEITKVKLVQGGVKGLKVTYSEITEKDGISFTSGNDSDHSVPVHKKLKSAVQRLKYHLIRIYGLHTPEFDKLIDKKDFSLMPSVDAKMTNEHAKAKKLMESIEVTGCSSTGDNFVITAKMKVLNNLTIGMATPNVDEMSEYPYFDEVIENTIEIFDETKKYLTEDVKIDRRQLVFDFYKDKSEELAALEGKSEEELFEKAQEIIEKLGGVVLKQEEDFAAPVFE